MPYKFEKMPLLKGTENDKRTKLTDEQKDNINKLKGFISQRKCASLFGVSRRTIVFLWNPEKLNENKKRRQERGGSKKYYNKEKNTQYQKTHRKHKKEVVKKLKIYDLKEKETKEIKKQ